MLDFSSPAVEARLNIDFAEVYRNSSLYKKNQKLIEELSTAAPGSKDLYFLTRYFQSCSTQFMACLWKQHLSYWRNPQHNAIRFFTTINFGLIFGTLFWNSANDISKQQDLLNIMGAMYASIFFLGGDNAFAVQSVVSVERMVFYREKAAGMYSSIPYALAQQLSIEILYMAVQRFLYGVILFSMLCFSWQAEKFFWFTYFNFICFLTFTLCGMMLLTLTPGPQMSALLMAFSSGLWSLFSGFTVPRLIVPNWVRWYYWASPAAWTICGILVYRFRDRESVRDPRRSRGVKVFQKDSYGYDYDFLKYVALVNTSFAIILSFYVPYQIPKLSEETKLGCWLELTWSFEAEKG